VKEMTASDTNTKANVVPPIQVIVWHDIFVMIDDGSADVLVYERLRQLGIEQSKRYPKGLGCLAIVPPNATPPPDQVRAAINAALASISLCCFCWLVEGSGFQGAMVRAVLTGMRLVSSFGYPTQIATHLDEAVAWILPHLDGGKTRLFQTRLVATAIRNQRAAGSSIVI
jgi:hypothetical protein